MRYPSRFTAEELTKHCRKEPVDRAEAEKAALEQLADFKSKVEAALEKR